MLAGATLFTTLEPCTTRNSPKLACAERIIERRIDRVVIGVLDPNDGIRGRGELRLRDAGIQIGRFNPDLMAQIEELNREFTRLHVDAQRLERAKAQTSDPADPTKVGRMATESNYTKCKSKSDAVHYEWPTALIAIDEATQILREVLETTAAGSARKTEIRMLLAGRDTRFVKKATDTPGLITMLINRAIELGFVRQIGDDPRAVIMLADTQDILGQ